MRFLSTPPSRVATPHRIVHTECDCSFYPRHPRGWRHGLLGQVLPAAIVSIHATLAGGDFRPNDFGEYQGVSIHATLAGGDVLTKPKAMQGTVSIHATLAGGDEYLQTDGAVERVFLSTPPSRVATHRGRMSAGVISVSIHATLAGGDMDKINQGTVAIVSIHATLAGGDLR